MTSREAESNTWVALLAQVDEIGRTYNSETGFRKPYLDKWRLDMLANMNTCLSLCCLPTPGQENREVGAAQWASQISDFLRHHHCSAEPRRRTDVISGPASRLLAVCKGMAGHGARHLASSSSPAGHDGCCLPCSCLLPQGVNQ